MAVQSKAWEQVGESFESLGTHLRSHFDDVSAEAAAERVAMEKSIRRLMSAFEDGFVAARKAVRDPVLRDDVSKVATSVRSAMLASFETAEGQVRERIAARPTRAVAKRAPAHKTTARKTTARKPAAKAAAGKRTAG